MKLTAKICIFALLTALLLTLFSVSVLATDTVVNDVVESEKVEQEVTESGKLDMNMIPESFAERAQLALQGTVTGMLMIFAVLSLLWGIVSLSKLFLYDIPNRRKNKAKSEENDTVSSPVVEAATVAPVAPVAQETDDGELAAVITAAIAAMIESGDNKNEFANGFRVVSFKRSAKNAWNRK